MRIVLIRNSKSQVKHKLRQDSSTPSLSPSSKSEYSIETLCAALLYMLSYYTHSPDPRLASEIARHLAWLKEAAHSEGCKGLGETAERLLALHWKNGQPIH